MHQAFIFPRTIYTITSITLSPNDLQAEKICKGLSCIDPQTNAWARRTHVQLRRSRGLTELEIPGHEYLFLSVSFLRVRSSELSCSLSHIMHEKHSLPSFSPRRYPPLHSLLLPVTIVYLIYALSPWTFQHRAHFDLKDVLLSVPSADHVRNWSAFYTTGESHLPGQGLHQAQWTKSKWMEFGIPNTHIASYDAQLPMPTGQQRLALLRGSELLYDAPLIDDENSSQTHGFVPAFYAFGASGNITASYVFANFGSEEDYAALVQANVSLGGKIALVKAADASPYLHHHGLEIRRGTQIANAAKYDLAGVVMYVDPQNDGPISEENGYQPYPDGPARPREAIERGTIGNIGPSIATRSGTGLA